MKTLLFSPAARPRQANVGDAWSHALIEASRTPGCWQRAPKFHHSLSVKHFRIFRSAAGYNLKLFVNFTSSTCRFSFWGLSLVIYQRYTSFIHLAVNGMNEDAMSCTFAFTGTLFPAVPHSSPKFLFTVAKSKPPPRYNHLFRVRNYCSCTYCKMTSNNGEHSARLRRFSECQLMALNEKKERWLAASRTI